MLVRVRRQVGPPASEGDAQRRTGEEHAHLAVTSSVSSSRMEGVRSNHSSVRSVASLIVSSGAHPECADALRVQTDEG